MLLSGCLLQPGILLDFSDFPLQIDFLALPDSSQGIGKMMEKPYILTYNRGVSNVIYRISPKPSQYYIRSLEYLKGIGTMASLLKEQQNKQVRRFVVLYLGIERDNFINTYLEQLSAKDRSEFIRQALYAAVRNAPHQLRLPEPGQPVHAEPELPPATWPDTGSDLSENALVAALLTKPDNNRRDQLLTQFTQADLETGADLMELLKDLLWQHYTGEQITSPSPPQPQDDKRQAALSAKLKKMSFAALTQ